MKKWLILFMLSIGCLTLTICSADTNSVPLSPDQAFALSVASTSAKGIDIKWKIAPGYHLYRDRIAVAVDPSTPHNATVLGAIDLPPGTQEQDPIQGKFQAYQQQLNINVPLTAPTQTPVTLLVDYQGCDEGSICYPPVTKQIKFNLTDNSSVVILNHDPVELAPITDMSPTSRVFSFFTAGPIMRKLFLAGAGVLLMLILLQSFISRATRATRRLEVE